MELVPWRGCASEIDLKRRPSVRFDHERLVEAVDVAQRGEFVECADYEVLWPVAKMMAKYLCENPEVVSGKRVVELGAGTGILGIVAARLGADAVVTDLPAALPLLRYNAHLNGVGASCKVERCVWGSVEDAERICRDGKVEVLMLCDLLYNQHESVIEQLIWTTKRLTAMGTTVLVAYETRENSLNNIAFFEEMQDFCDCRAVSMGEYADDDIRQAYDEDDLEGCLLYVYTPEADKWEVPEPLSNPWSPPEPQAPAPFPGGRALLNGQQRTPATVSVETAGKAATPMLEVGYPYPTTRKTHFAAFGLGDRECEVRVVVGESHLVSGNVEVGRLRFALPDAEQIGEDGEGPAVAIEATIDASGRLSVVVTALPGEELARMEVPGDSWPSVSTARTTMAQRLEIEARNGDRAHALRELRRIVARQSSKSPISDELAAKKHALEAQRELPAWESWRGAAA